MTDIVTFTAADVMPDRADVLINQGIPAERILPAVVEKIFARALEVFTEAARPVGILAEISPRDFKVVYDGEGCNEPVTPVGNIVERAERLALYAATVGAEVSNRIDACFQAKDFALATMLDSTASAAADKLGELMETRFARSQADHGSITPGQAALRYSPGYCGWHISGQKRLFEFLKPEAVGIHLRESFLMQPLKSVSGAVIVGPEDMHAFPDTYSFCDRCKTHGCRERIRSLESR